MKEMNAKVTGENRNKGKRIICHGNLACEQALLFGQAKRASRERASEGPTC